jgi:hypothetical protein
MFSFKVKVHSVKVKVKIMALLKRKITGNYKQICNKNLDTRH